MKGKFTKLLALMFVFALSAGVYSCEFEVDSSSSSSPVSSVDSSVDSSDSSSDVEEEQTLSVFGNWEDIGDGVYTFTENTETSLIFSYQKDESMGDLSWSCAVRTLEGDLSMYKTLRFTVVGSGMIKLKIEAEGGTGREVDIAVTGIEAPYEWNLIPESDFLKNVKKIVIFGHPGKKVGSGTVTVKKFEFSTYTADGPAIIQTGFNNIPDDVNEYNGTDETFSFNAKWQDNGDGCYTFEYVDDGVVVNYNKGSFAWAFFKSKVFGPLGNFQYITLKVSGQAGTRFLVKAAEPNHEKTFKLTQTDVVETFVFDLTKTLSKEQRDGITQILIFVAPDTQNVSGTIKIHEAYFTNVNENPTTEPTVNVYEGETDPFHFTHWVDGGGLDYVTTVEGTDTIVTYDKAGTYSAVKSYVQGNFGDFKYIVVKVQGAAESTIMLKVEEGPSKVERTFELTGEVDEFVLDISVLTKEVRNTIKSVQLIAAPGQKVAGTLTIKEAYFTNNADPGEPEIVYHEYKGTGIDFNINVNWYDGGDGVYSVAKEGAKVVVDYDKQGKEWSVIKSYITGTGKLSDFVALVGKVKGPAGEKLLIKVDAPLNRELWLDATGEVQDFRLNLSDADPALLNAVQTVVVFAEPGDGEGTGQFEIHEMKFVRNVAKYESGDTFAVVNDWFDFDGIYQIVNGETVEVTYQKEPDKHAWACMLTLVEGDFSEFTKVVFNVEGEEGKELLLKVEGTAGAKEGRVTMTGAAADLELDISTFEGRHGINKVLIFADPGTPGTSGSFRINSVTFVK